MKTKRSQEGYVEIDHRYSPGLPPHLAALAYPEVPHPLLGPAATLEAPTMGCSHCQAIVVLNPARTRERAWCRTCDAYLCDQCGAAQKAGAPCKTFEQLVVETQEQAARALGIKEL